MDFRKVTSEHIRLYRNEVLKSASASTFDRKMFSLRKFFDWAVKEGYLDENPAGEFLKSEAETLENKLGKIEKQKKLETPSYNSVQARIVAKLAGKPKLQKLAYGAFYTRPKWYKSYHNLPIASYFNYGILVLLMSALGFGVYNQFFKTTSTPLAYPTTLTAAGRYLSFQGRLTNNLGNPITTARNVNFKLYNAATSGTLLWDSGTCSITPDTDGIFSTLLGSSCGAEIGSSVFSENSAVWLGVTVGADTEATPRVQIATVAYALNSQTLQGYPASESATANTIPAINSSGYLVLGTSSPKIMSTSGNFAIQGQSMTFTTPTASNGNITVAPDGTGVLNLTFTGAAPGGSAKGFVNATDANLTSGSLYYGAVASGATGYNLLQLQSGSTLTNKFVIDSAGNATAAGTVNGLAILGGTISGGTWNGTAIGTQYGGTGQNWASVAQGSIPYFSGTGTMSTLVPGTGGYVLSTNGTGQDPSWIAAGSVGYWQFLLNSISPVNSTYAFNIGDTASSSALFHVPGTIGSNAWFNMGAGNLGIGTVTPLSKLSVVGNSANSIGKAAFLVDQYESQDILTASASGTTKMTLANDGTLKLYNASSSIANTTGDVTIDAAGGQLILAGTDTINIGGLSGYDYNSLALSGDIKDEAAVAAANDLYIGGDLEVDGVLYSPQICLNGDCQTAWPTGSVSYWRLDATGKVLSPTQAAYDLTVGANATGAAFQVFAATGNITTSGNLSVSGYATTSASLALGNTNAALGPGNLNMSGNLTAGGTTGFGGLTYTWPGSRTAGNFLTTDGSGVLSWSNTLPSTTTIGFDKITGATNTTAAMIVGTGSSLTYSGGTQTSGVINANQLLGATWAAPGAIGTTTAAAGNFTTIGATTQGTGAFTTLSFTYATSSGSLALGNATAALGPGHLNMSGNLVAGGTASVSGSLTFRAGAGAIQATNMSDLTLGGNTTGNVVAASPFSAGSITDTGLTASKGVFTDANKKLTSTGTLGVDQGGTGFTTYAVGDLLTAGTTTSLSRLADVATGNVLISGGLNTIPSWGKVVLGTHTSGNYVSSLAGTGNQITASGSTGDITLSIPSDFRAPGTVNAVNGIYTGSTAGLQRIDATGNLVNIVNISASGYATVSGSLALGTTAAPGPGNLNMSGNLVAGGTINGLTVSSGTISSGTWNGTAVGTQWGGTGKDWHLTAAGSIVYFDSQGSMSTLSPSTNDYVLTTQGSGTPQWKNVTTLVPASTNYWRLDGTNMVLSPTQAAYDLTVGANATGAAFQVFAATGDVKMNNASMSGTLTVANGQTIKSAYGPLTLSYKSAANAWTPGLTLADVSGNVLVANDLQVAGNDILDSAAATRVSLGATTTLTNTTTTLSGTTTMTASSLATLTTAANLAMSSTTGLTLGGNSTINGGTGVSGTLRIDSTSNATKGNISFNGTTTYVDGSGNIHGTTIYQGANQVCDASGAGCPASMGVNYWQLANHVVAPANATDYDLAIGGNATASSKFQINAATGNIYTANNTVDWTLNGAADALNFDANTLSLDALNNRVGIGTAAPGEKLEVTGNILASNNAARVYITALSSNTIGPEFRIASTDTGGHEYRIGSSASGNSIGVGSFYFYDQTISAMRFVIDPNGLFGIGKSAPTAKLDVADTSLAGINDNIVSATSSAMQSGNLLKIGEGGTQNFTGNAIFADIANGGGGSFTGNFIKFNNKGTTVFTVDSLGNADIRGVNYSWPTAAAAGVLTSDGSGNLSWGSAGTNYWRLDGTGKVLSPIQTAYDLTVGGEATSSSKFQIMGTTGNIYTANNTVDWTLNNAADALNFDANTMSIDALNNRVGIGTIGPDSPLDVLSIGGSQLRLTYTDGTVYTTLNTDTSGNLTIDATGTKTIIADDLQITGNDILDSGAATRVSLGATTTLTNTTTTLSGTTTMTASSLATLTTAASVAMSSTTGLTLGGNSTINGGSVSAGTLRIDSTSNATKGNISFNGTTTFIDGLGNLKVGGYATASASLNVGSGNASPGIGNISYSNALLPGGVAGTSGYLLTSAEGGVNTWTNPANLGTNYWQLANHVLAPANAVDYDLAVGGNSTASAKFQVFAATGDATMSGSLTLGYGKALQSAYGPLTLNYKSGANTWAAGLTVSDVTGYVGIGTTTPNNLIQVAGLINFDNTDFNTKIGYQAGNNVVTGAQYNTFLGYQAGLSGAAGGSAVADYNTGVGSQSLLNNTTGHYNTAVGSSALHDTTTGYYNTAIGVSALYSNTTGDSNVAVGLNTLANNTTGYSNVAIGNSVLDNGTAGYWNIGIGEYALRWNTLGYDNTALGKSAIKNNYTGFSNNAIGSYALANLSATNHTITALANSTVNPGTKTTVTSASHGLSNGAAIAVFKFLDSTVYDGYWTVSNVTTDTFDIPVTYSTAYAATMYWTLQSEAYGDVALGDNAGYGAYTGSLNTFIGYHADTTLSSAVNSMALGNAATVTASNQIVLGNSAITNVITAGALNAGGLTGIAYNSFAGSGDSPAATTAITASNDLFVGGDLEIKSGLYLATGSKTIYNVTGTTSTATEIFATDPALINNYNTLTNGSWLINNSTNNGIAALMVNQAKGGDILTASASGTTRLRLDNTGKLYFGGSAYYVDNGGSALFNGLSTNGNVGFGNGSTDTVTSNAGVWSFPNVTNIDLKNTTNDALSFETSLLSLDTATSGVGILTTTPSGTFDVNGNVFIRDNANMASVLSGYKIAASGGVNYFESAGAAMGNGTGADLRFTSMNTAATWLAIQASTGNVGIGGMTSPAARLHIQDAASTGNGTIQFGATATTGYYSQINQAGNDLTLIANGDQAYRVALGTNNGTGNLVFQTAGMTTGNTERMRIAYNGNVGIGTNGPSYPLTVNASNPGCNGCTLWTNYSDQRLKENIANISDEVLGKIMQLNPVTFKYNDVYYSQTGYTRPDGTTPTYTGFIAQDLQQIFPEMVSTSSNGYLDTNLSNLQLYLVKGLQELNTKVTNLNLPSVATDSGYLNIASDNNGEYVLTDTSNGSVISNIGAFAQAVAANIKAGAVVTQDLAANTFTSFQGTVDNMLVKSGLVAGNIQTKMISPLADATDVTIQVGSATQSGKLAVQNAAGAEVASIDSEGNATFSGTLYADTINSKSLDDMQALLTKVQVDQELLAQSSTWSINTATNSATISNGQLAISNLYVTNQAAINSLSVTNSLAIGTDMIIQSSIGADQLAANTIDTLSSPLKIQSLAMAPVEIMAGLIKIDTKGNVQITGNLAVAGKIESAGLSLKDNQQSASSSALLTLQNSNGNTVSTVDASGSASFSSISTQGLTIAGAVDATNSAVINGVITTNATAGTGIITAGTSEITIKNNSVTDYTLVYVTPTSSTENYVLYVKSKAPGQFVVGFTNPIDIDVNFNWWIVRVSQ